MFRRNERGFTLVEAIVAMMVCTDRTRRDGRADGGDAAPAAARSQLDERGAPRPGQGRRVDDDEFHHEPRGGMRRFAHADDVANHNDTPMEDNGTPDDPPTTRSPKATRAAGSSPAGPDGDPNLRTVTVRVIPDVNDRRTSRRPMTSPPIIRGVRGRGMSMNLRDERGFTLAELMVAT